MAAAVAIGLGVVLLAGCGGNKPQPTPAPTSTASALPPEPAGPPPPEPIETGKDCAKATIQCGGGACTAKITNDCDAAVTCDLKVMVTCSTNTTTGEARGNNRGTVGKKSTGEVTAQGSCEGGAAELTVPDSLGCK